MESTYNEIKKKAVQTVKTTFFQWTSVSILKAIPPECN